MLMTMDTIRKPEKECSGLLTVPGVAFTKSYVGYIHAVAHSLGGQYGTPHGLANAVILPIVLRIYGPDCEKKLGTLARNTGVAKPEMDDEKLRSVLLTGSRR